MNRLHHLDAARALLLLMGLPFHVATKAIFESEPNFLAFQQSLTIGLFASVTHAFRMFAFFMLAGYFAGMVRARRGRGAWMAERFSRLGLPLVVSLLTIGGVQFVLQGAVLGHASPTFLGLPIALDHLWFLIVLLGYCLTYFAVPVERLPGTRGINAALTLSGPSALLLMAALAAWGLLRYAIETLSGAPENPSEAQLALHFMFHSAAFLLGVLAWHGGIGERLFALKSRLLVPATLVLLAAYLPFDPLVRPALGLEIYPDFVGILTIRALELPLALLMSLCLFRLLAKVVTGPSRVIAFLVDGALAIYLFHLIWVIAVLGIVRSLPWPAEAQWFAASLAVFALSIASFIALRGNRVLSALFCGTPWRGKKAAPAAA